MAAVVGPFEGFAHNREPMLRVMQMHRDAVEEINNAGPQYLKDASRKLWDEVLALGKKVGYRNAQATVIAPTGTSIPGRASKISGMFFLGQRSTLNVQRSTFNGWARH